MRVLFVIVASLALVLPGVSPSALAEESAAAGGATAQAEATPKVMEGEKVFATTCGYCHQKGGRVAGKGPKLSKSERSDEFIVERIKKGKPGQMPGYGSQFSDSQIAEILAYIRGLDD